LLSDDSQSLPAAVGTSPRTDGKVQLTYQGRPLYTYAGDKKPGDTKGDGLSGIWHVVKETP
jgi:predicted lipoprotein with Yx(FWY)xxD motif